MTRDPFLRLALVALCSVYVLAIVVVSHVYGHWVAIGVAVGGATVATACSIEPEGDERSALAELQARARHARRFRVGPRE